MLQCSILLLIGTNVSKTQAQRFFSQAMRKATQLTQMGALMDATRLIQRALGGAAQPARPQTQPKPRPAHAANDAQIEDVEARIIDMPAPQRQKPQTEPVTEPVVEPATQPVRPARKASFTESVFLFEGAQYPYRLFVPAAPETSVETSAPPMPLIVLLHGCKQNAQDFARGTAMNGLAGQQQCMVLYPEQISSANAARCWNWFEPGHQKAGRGEPGMIAALTQKVLASNYQGQQADSQRVYIAGLSAGGAMAAVVTGLYPDMFAALGVHSGLAAGAAQDLMSAFSAMRKGAKGRTSPALPTIVFHGAADTTVHPDNGEHITDAALAALQASGLVLVESKSKVSSASDQLAERVVYSAADGTPYVESWLVDAGPHAWSGGNAAGSYTNPDGPDASAALLAFFLQHKKSQPES